MKPSVEEMLDDVLNPGGMGEPAPDVLFDFHELAYRIGGVMEPDKYTRRRTHQFCRSVLVSISGLCRDKKYMPTDDMGELLARVSDVVDSLRFLTDDYDASTSPTDEQEEAGNSTNL